MSSPNLGAGIQNAYIQMISEASHFVYIENQVRLSVWEALSWRLTDALPPQFFITNTRPSELHSVNMCFVC